MTLATISAIRVRVHGYEYNDLHECCPPSDKPCNGLSEGYLHCHPIEGELKLVDDDTVYVSGDNHQCFAVRTNRIEFLPEVKA